VCKRERENETRTETFNDDENSIQKKEKEKKDSEACYREEQKGEQGGAQKPPRDCGEEKSKKEKKRKERKTKKSSLFLVSLPSARPRPFIPSLPCCTPSPSSGSHCVLLRLPVLGQIRFEGVDVALES
jgi:hypothetical protein